MISEASKKKIADIFGLNLLAYGLLIPALALNLLLLILANHLLSPINFATFFAVINCINILVFPAGVLNGFLVRFFSNINSESPARANTYREVAIGLVFYTAIFLSALVAALYFLVDNLFLLLGNRFWFIIVPACFGLYAIEAIRGIYLGQKQYLNFSLLIPIILVLRFTICGGLLVVTQNPLISSLGLAVAPWPVLIFTAVRHGNIAPAILSRLGAYLNNSGIMNLNLRYLLNSIFVLFLFGIIAYFDLIFVYIFFDSSDLASFAASGFIAKALIILAGPYANLVLNNVAADNATQYFSLRRYIFFLLLLLFVSFVGVIMFSLVPNGCSSDGLVIGCQKSLMINIWIAATAICCLRISLSYAIVYGQINSQVPIYCVFLFGGWMIYLISRDFENFINLYSAYACVFVSASILFSLRVLKDRQS